MTSNLNMDLTERVVLDSEKLDWVDTRLAGVQRRMLEREGAESGRATSVVRYAPDSHFSAHVHDGGEEFVVLDGVFSDERGDFGPGSYVRNPVGSKHRPHSDGGCTILVKLGQMDPDDQSFVRIDTTTGDWQPGHTAGVSVMPLHSYGAERVSLERWQPGARAARHIHPGGEEIFVIAGSFEDEDGTYTKGAWLRNPPGSTHAPSSRGGCVNFLKEGHLG